VDGPLLVADLPWLLYRSYFALPRSITDDEGRPVNALLGTVNALLATLEALRATPPRALVACTGAEDAVYRTRLYPPYHAHRDPMPDDLATQWQLAPELLRAVGWGVSGTEELEADDVMFSYAREESERGGATLVLSGDRDLYGAVEERVRVLELRGRGAPTQIGVEEVRTRAGVEPGQIPDLIALRGDPSDGIPGAPGVGAKTAAALLRGHGTLEAVLDAAREVAVPRARRPAVAEALRPRVAEALLEHEQQLRVFKEIATLQRIPVAPAQARPADWTAGADAAESLGMRRLAERLRTLAA
jgi:5'-3' exonuclease